MCNKSRSVVTLPNLSHVMAVIAQIYYTAELLDRNISCDIAVILQLSGVVGNVKLEEGVVKG